MAATIVWFRQDLRLHDHPALHAAIARGQALVLVYIQEPSGPWRPGAALRFWLHQSLVALASELRRHGHRLVFLQGEAHTVLARLIDACGADALYFNRRYEPHDSKLDAQLERALRGGCEVRHFAAHLLFEPARVRTGSGTPYRVFTPYYRACLQLESPAPPLPAPTRWPPAAAGVVGLTLAELELEPKIAWAGGIARRWPAGEQAAHVALDEFVDERLRDYTRDRDLPARDATAGLSPYLSVGAISARSCWQAVQAAALRERDGGQISASEAWLRQLVWREFAYHLLHHFPHPSDAPFRAQWQTFAWSAFGILLMLTIALRNPILAVLAILPTMLSVVLVLGLMGWSGVKLDMATALVASVALGLSVDDTFHCLLQYRRERRTRSFTESLLNSYAVTGPGVILSSLAVAAGFAALRLSEFAPFANFGTMVGIATAGSTLGNLVLLPSCLTLGERLKNRIRRDRQTKPTPVVA